MLGTMPTLADGHSFRLVSNIVSTGSSHPRPIGSVASVIGSILPDRSVGALHPIVLSSLQPFIGSIASDIRSVFGAKFGCACPGVRCAPYLGAIIQ